VQFRLSICAPFGSPRQFQAQHLRCPLSCRSHGQDAGGAINGEMRLCDGLLGVLQRRQIKVQLMSDPYFSCNPYAYGAVPDHYQQHIALMIG